MKVQAIYTCRLCGRKIRMGEVTESTEDNLKMSARVIAEGRSATCPALLPHVCPGERGVGIAVFSGMENVETPEPGKKPAARRGNKAKEAEKE